MKKIKIKRCPCGHIPEKINIDARDSKWFLAVPSCCDEWIIEFRSCYHPADSEEAKKRAIEAWNFAPRG